MPAWIEIIQGQENIVKVVRALWKDPVILKKKNERKGEWKLEDGEQSTALKTIYIESWHFKKSLPSSLNKYWKSSRLATRDTKTEGNRELSGMLS